MPPIVGKREGFNSKALDIFATETLRANTIEANLGAYLPGLETVDYVGDASAIEDVLRPFHGPGSLSYVISSHNFEHLPNPIRFLRGCATLLSDGGVLTMALPDKRGSFDYFRPHSTTGDLIQAFFENRERPTPHQRFLEHSLHCRYSRNGQMEMRFDLSDDPAAIVPANSVDMAFEEWMATRGSTAEIYHDCHCSIFTPSSFALIMLDLYWLNLSDFRLMDLAALPEGEFVVHLKKHPVRDADWAARYLDERTRLLTTIMDECAANAPRAWRAAALARAWKRVKSEAWLFKPKVVHDRPLGA